MKKLRCYFTLGLATTLLSSLASSQTDGVVGGEQTPQRDSEPVPNIQPTTIKFGMTYGNPIPSFLALQIFSNTTLHQINNASTVENWTKNNGFSTEELDALKVLLSGFQTSLNALEAERLKISCEAYDESRNALVDGRAIELTDEAYANLEAPPPGASALYDSVIANIGSNFSREISSYVTVNIENIIKNGTASAFDYKKTNAAFGVTDETFFDDLCK